jgi:hypothetical protein
MEVSGVAGLVGLLDYEDHCFERGLEKSGVRIFKCFIFK